MIRLLPEITRCDGTTYEAAAFMVPTHPSSETRGLAAPSSGNSGQNLGQLPEQETKSARAGKHGPIESAPVSQVTVR